MDGVAEQPERVAVAYSLALRITADATAAEAICERTADAASSLGELVRDVRNLARVRRSRTAVTRTTRPHLLLAMDPYRWQLLDTIALQGMTLGEASAEFGVAEAELRRDLRLALGDARRSLRSPGPGQLDHEPRAAGRDRLGPNRPAVRLHDAPRNR